MRKIIILGRMISGKIPSYYVKVASNYGDANPFALWNLFRDKHKKSARTLFWLLVGSIVSIEIVVRLNGGLHYFDEFFWIHIVSAVTYFILLGLLNWPLNGIKSTKYHKYFAYACLVAFIFTLVTATILIVRL